MPVRMRLICQPLVVALLVSLAAGPAAAQKAPATPAACTDFHGHANAGWLGQNPLPSSANSLSRWDQINGIGRMQRDQLLGATTAPEGAVVSGRLSDLIASSQDEAAIEAAGTGAMKPLLARIEKIRKPRDIAAAIADLHAAGVPVLVDFQVMRDAQAQPYAQIGPAGLGLPDAGFYTSPEPEARAVELRYRALVTEWLRLTGTPEKKLAEQAGWVMAMESQLAQSALTGAPFQVMAFKDAELVASGLALGNFLQVQGLKATQVAMVGPQFFQVVNRMLDKTPVEQWKVYLRAQVVRDLAPTLGKAYRDPWAQLYDVTLAGETAPLTRLAWLQRMLQATAPELVDGAFHERFLPEPRRLRAEQVAEAVRASAIAAVDGATWLSPEGKTAARQRLSTMQVQIGRPLPAQAFSDLRLDRASLAGNVLALRQWLHRYTLVRARYAWPAEQWQPLVVLMPQENRLVVTASLLQSPVLGDGATAADFGGFGALVGQQIALGLQNWNGVDATAWSKRAMPLIAQYNAYPVPGTTIKVNGSRSFAQNQADLAGLELAWDALGKQGTPAAPAAQAFFGGWATLWARHDRPASLAAMQANSLHAPAQWRVNGPLSNLPAFATAYGCKGKVAMQRPAKEQVALWRR